MKTNFSQRLVMALHHANYLADMNADTLDVVQSRLDTIAEMIATELHAADIEEWLRARAANEGIPNLVLSVMDREYSHGYLWCATLRSDTIVGRKPSSSGLTLSDALKSFRKNIARQPEMKRAEIARITAELAAMEGGKS